MAEARILSRVHLPQFLPGGLVEVWTQLTYVIGIQPPRTIYIKKPDPTDAEIVEAIKADQAQPPPGSPQVLNI